MEVKPRGKALGLSPGFSLLVQTGMLALGGMTIGSCTSRGLARVFCTRVVPWGFAWGFCLGIWPEGSALGFDLRVRTGSLARGFGL